MRFSWQSGTLMGQSYYKWIVISLIKSMVRLLHPSSCFSFFIPLWLLPEYTIHFRCTHELETKRLCLLGRKKKKKRFLFLGHIHRCCGAACFYHTMLIWFKSKLLWLNTLSPATMQSVFSQLLSDFHHINLSLLD